MRWFVMLSCLGALLATPAVAQVDPALNPLFRPRGAIVRKGEPHYYVWYEGALWHVRSTSPKLRQFHGTITIRNGRITYCRLIGREKNDTWRFGKTRNIVQFKFQTAAASDGLDFKVVGAENAEVVLDLRLDKRKPGLKNVHVGAAQLHPRKLPLVFPARPNRTMYAPAGRARLPKNPLLLLTFEPQTFTQRNGKPFVADQSGNQNDCRVSNARAGAGKVGGGIDFGSEASSLYTPFKQDRVKTAALWVRPRGFQVYRQVLSGGRKISGGTNGMAFSLVNAQDGQFLFGKNAPNWNAVACKHELAKDTWSHIALTIDVQGKRCSYFRNGELVLQAALPQTYGLAECRAIISSDWTGHALDGLMDELAIYDRVLSPQEIKSLYVLGAAGKRLTDAAR